jgi:hypothetical protein
MLFIVHCDPVHRTKKISAICAIAGWENAFVLAAKLFTGPYPPLATLLSFAEWSLWPALPGDGGRIGT